MEPVTDADLTTICGLIVRGTSLATACELVGVTLDDLFAHIGDAPGDLTALFSAMMSRAQMNRVMPDFEGDSNS